MTMRDYNDNTFDVNAFVAKIKPRSRRDIPEPQMQKHSTPGAMVETDFGEMIPAQTPVDPTPFELDKGKQLVALDAEYDRLQKAYDTKLPEWNKERDAGRPMIGGMYGSPVHDMVSTPKEQKDWESALTELRIARNKLHSYTNDELEQDRKTGTQKSRTRQFIEGFTSPDVTDVMTFGWDETGRKLRQATAIKKLNRGEKLAPGEEALVAAFRAGQAADQYLASKGGNTSWAGVGESVSASIPFMIQMGLTGGTGGIVKFGANAAVKKGVTGALKRGALKTAEMAANSALQTPLTSSPYTNYAERTLEQYDVDLNDKGQLTATLARPTSEVQRSWQGFATGFSDVFSERFGNVLPTGQAIGNFIKGFAPKALGKSIGGALAKGIDALDNPTVQQMNKWLRKVPGYNGTAGEFAEELANNVIEPVLTGEVERIPENFSRENLWQTAMSVAIMGGMMETARVPAMAMDARHRAQIRKEAQTRLNTIENPTVKQALTEAMAVSGNEERAKRLSAINWKGVTTPEAAAAMDYVELRTYGDLSGGIAEAMQEQQKIQAQVQTFNQFANIDTGRAEIVTDPSGARYFVRSGSLDGTGTDATVFVQNAETGEVTQMGAGELALQDSYDLDGYIQMLQDQEHTTDTELANDLVEIAEDAQETGTDPGPAIAARKGIDLSDLTGRTVTLADGTECPVMVSRDNRGQVAIYGVTVDENGNEITLPDPINIADIVAVDGQILGDSDTVQPSKQAAIPTENANAGQSSETAPAQEVPVQAQTARPQQTFKIGKQSFDATINEDGTATIDTGIDSKKEAVKTAQALNAKYEGLVAFDIEDQTDYTASFPEPSYRIVAKSLVKPQENVVPEVAALTEKPADNAETVNADQAPSTVSEEVQSITEPPTKTIPRPQPSAPKDTQSTPEKKQPKKVRKPAKSEVTTDTSEKQNTKPEYGSGNKLVTSDRYEDLRKRMKEKLSNLNSGFDPEVMAMGAEMAVYHLEAGVRKFADVASTLIDDLGDNVRPYIKSFYEGARRMPGVDTTGMDSTEFVDNFDLDALQIPNTEQNTTTDERATEIKAEQQPEPETPSVAEPTIADVEAIERETEALANEATTITDRQRSGELLERIDGTIEVIEDALSFSNSYAVDQYNEYPSVGVAKSLKRDLTKVSKRLATVLNWDHDTTAKGKTEYATSNVAPAGGDGHIILWKPNSDYGVYVSVPVRPDYINQDADWTIEHVMKGVGPILWRITTKDRKYTGRQNHYWPEDITVGQMAKDILSELEREQQRDVQNNTVNKTVSSTQEEKSPETVSKPKIDERNDNTGIPDTDGNYPPALDAGTRAVSPDGAISDRQTPGISDGAGTVSGTTKSISDEPGNDGIRSDGGGDGIPAGTGQRNRSGRAARTTVRKTDAGNSQEPARVNNRNFRLPETDDQIAPRGEIAKIKANITAIELLRKLESEDRAATAEEQKILAQYTGWGGLATVLDKHKADEAKYSWSDQTWNKKYGKLHRQIVELLSEQEFTDAINSTINAHYTSPAIIRRVWGIAEQLGFTGGTILEPAFGIGHFFGLIPNSISERSNLRAYELDSISGRIAAKLYPDAAVRVTGYENANEGPGSIDLAITNVPFGKIAPYDKANKDLSKFSLHNYFIAKGIRQLKPGGLGIFITSASTMDSPASAKFREWVTSEGNTDFIGAVRLPNTTFETNAGTEVTTDIVIFRKRDSNMPTEQAQGFRFTKVIREVKGTDGTTTPIEVNEYFAEHPEMMLGEMKLASEAKKGNLYRADSQTLEAKAGTNIPELLDKAVVELPSNLYKGAATPLMEIKSADTDDKNYTFVNRDGNLYFVENGDLTPVIFEGGDTVKINKTTYQKKQIVEAFLSIKDTVKQLVALEQTRADEAELETLRQNLANQYNDFKGKYGTFFQNSRIDFLQDDSEHNFVYALEHVEKATEMSPSGRALTKYTVTPAEILSKRVSYPVQVPEHAENLSDAISIALRYDGRLDVSHIAELLATDEQSVTNQMLSEGLAYVDPATGMLEDKDSYLSGFVRTKFHAAEDAASLDPKYKANVEALKRVLPDTIPASLIKFRMSSTWLPSDIHEQFILDNFKVKAKVTFVPEIGSWTVHTVSGAHNVENQTTYGTSSFSAVELVEKILNLKQPEVWQTVGYGSDKKRVKDQEATLEAQAQMRDIENLFVESVSDNSEQMQRIETIYNEQFNDYVERKESAPAFDHFPGANAAIQLRGHQKRGVARLLRDSTLLAHQVGTGKTFTMITGAMEMRRLGLARKPMIVVQNATLEQFGQSFKELYPAANILVPTKKQMQREHRQRLFNAIAYGDWDAVIIPQSFVDFIPDDADRVRNYLQEQIHDLEVALTEAELEGESDRIVIQNLKSTLDTLQKQLDAVNEPQKEKGPKVKDVARKQLSITKSISRQADRRTDDVFTFEKMGVDALFVDEAHAYKKYGIFTKMSRVKGIDTSRSKRAFGMYMKVRWVQEKAGGRNVIFATGTPITNTMAEVWTMMKFIAPDILQKYHIATFDEFASTFGSVEPSLEFTASGNFKVVERFKSYINAPELLTAFRSKTDVVLTEDIPEFKENNSIPKLKDGQFTQIVLPQSEALENVMADIKAELLAWEKLSGKEKRAKSYIPLVMFNRAKQASIDLRLLDPNNPDDPGSKTNRVVNEVHRIYQATSQYKGTQLVFADMYQSPERADSNTPRFNLYQDIKQKLTVLGIPEKEIAVITDFKDDKREWLFQRINAGDIRILLGGTERMGVGVNVQERLAALHHVDAPPRPMDFEQRNGRILRQGNTHANMELPVEVLTYGVEKTLDATAYQRLAIKQKFINQMMKGESLEREMADSAEEDSPTDMTFDQMMSMLSGNQWAMLHMKKSYDLKKLESAEKSYRRRLIEIRRDIGSRHEQLRAINNVYDDFEKANKIILDHFPDGKLGTVTIDGKIYTEKLGETIENAIQDYVKRYKASRLTTPLKVRLNDLTDPVTIMRTAGYEDRFEYTFNFSEAPLVEIKSEIASGAGFVTSVTAQLKRITGEVAHLARKRVELEQAIPKLEAELQKPFGKADQLKQLRDEVADIEVKMKEDLSEMKESTPEKSVSSEDIMLRDDAYINAQFNDYLRQQINSTLPKGHIYQLGMPSAALKAAGVPDLPIEMSAARLEVKASDDYENNHPFELSQVMNLPQAIANPIAVFDSKTQRSSKVILTELTSGATNFIVAIRAENKRISGRRILEVNSIRSIYPKDYTQDIVNWINRGDLLKWVNKEKASDWLGKQQSNSADVAIPIKGIDVSANIIKNFTNPTIIEGEKTSMVETISEALNTPIRVLTDDAHKGGNSQRANGKGWYDRTTGEVVVVLPNNTDAADVQRTVLHEVVAHKGIDQLFGKEKADFFYRTVYASLDERTQRQWSEALRNETTGRTQSTENIGGEYVAYIAEGNVSPSIMKRILAAIRNFFRDVLGIPLRISDNDIRYMLWRSQKNLRKSTTVSEALNTIDSDIRMRSNLGINSPEQSKTPSAYQYLQRLSEQMNEDQVWFRRGAGLESEPTQVVNPKDWRSTIARKLQDATLPVKQLQETIKQRGGTVDITNDVHTALNRVDSAAKAKIDRFDRDSMQPIINTVREIMREHKIDFKEVDNYLQAKHSLERHDSGVSALSETGAWTREACEEMVLKFEETVSVETVKQLWEHIRRATKARLDAELNSGLITMQQYRDIFSNGWQYYVPLQGIDFDYEGIKDPHEQFADLDYGFGTGTGARTTIKQAKGRGTKADNAIGNIRMNAHRAIMAGEKNLARQTLLRLVDANSKMTDLFKVEGRWFVRIPESALSPEDISAGSQFMEVRKRPADEDIAKSLEARQRIKKYRTLLDAEKLSTDKTIPYEDRLTDLRARRDVWLEKIANERDNITVTNRPEEAGRYRGLPDTVERKFDVTFYKNGVKYVVRMSDAAVSRAINRDLDNLWEKYANSWLGRKTAWATRGLAALSTSKNPAFLMANFIRDTQHAGLYSWVDSDGNFKGYARNIKPSFGAINRYLRGKADPFTINERQRYNLYDESGRIEAIEQFGRQRVMDSLYEDFVMNGGQTGYVHIEDAAEYSRRIAKRMKRELTGGSIVRGWEALNEGLEYMGNLSENAVRFATFMSQIEAGADALTAVNYAKNVTVNFNTKGEYGRGIGTLYMFFNAGMQGLDNMYKMTIQNKRRAAVAIAWTMAAGYINSLLIDLFMEAAGGDDDDWRISDYERRTNIIIPSGLFGGDKGYIKIPIPILIRPAWSAGIITNDVIKGRVRAKDAWGTLLQTCTDTVSPVEISADTPFKSITPTAIKPLLEVGVWNTDFTGRKINREPFTKQLQELTPDSQLGQHNANEILKSFTKWLNELAGGNEVTPAGLRSDGSKSMLNWLDISPSSLEHLLTSYTGGIGKEVNRTIHFIMDRGDERRVRNWPVLNRFYGESYQLPPSVRYNDIRAQYKFLDAIYSRNEKAGLTPRNLAGSKEEAAVKHQEVEQVMRQLKIYNRKIDRIKARMDETTFSGSDYEALKKEMFEQQREFIKWYDNASEN